MRTTINPLVRSVGIFGAVAAIATGVTFAALNSQATLTDNTISSTTADLKVYDFAVPGFVSSAPGFTITDLVPGTGVTKTAYFQNGGGVPLTVTAHVPTLPSSSGFSGWNNLTVDITAQNCLPVVHTDMAALNAGEVAMPCNPLAAGATGDSNTFGTPGNYDFHFDVVSASITGSQVTVDGFNLVFTGTQPL